MQAGVRTREEKFTFTGPTKFDEGPPLYVGGMHPSWSPDGSQIAFESDRDGDYEIYIMAADGSNQRRLVNL